jgi:hypothetical protein
MNDHQQTDQTTRAVPCLVALLFSLAVIAEWAATAPAPVRYAVLAILRRAEAIAYSVVYWKIHDQGLTLQWALPHGCRQYSDPEAAMMFGWWFRILAVALRDLPRRALVATKARTQWRAGLIGARPPEQFAHEALPAHDTS